MVDVEVTDNVDKITLQKNLKTYLEIIESNYGIKPIIYSSQKFFLKNLLPFVNEYPTWVARYNSIAPRISFEKNWAFWQYGDHGKIRGIDGPVDLNVFKGTLRELEMFSIPGDRLLSLSK